MFIGIEYYKLSFKLYIMKKHVYLCDKMVLRFVYNLMECERTSLHVSSLNIVNFVGNMITMKCVVCENITRNHFSVCVCVCMLVCMYEHTYM